MLMVASFLYNNHCYRTIAIRYERNITQIGIKRQQDAEGDLTQFVMFDKNQTC